jgi:P4 family phage/plasmid primase-like protien
MTRNELGPLDMEKYLNYFGIVFDIKDDGEKTLYRLEKCLFNPDHGPNEASIVVPRIGPILYQCFHASCRGNTWKDARRKISGDRPLREFCTGYDPNWVPPRQTGTGMMANLSIPMLDAAALKNGIGGGPAVPQPADVDPREFYEKKGKRPVFVPFYLAKYLAAYLYPICATNGIFYHYENGLWREFSKTAIGQICVHAMREEIQAAWIDNVAKILAGLVNREESEWPNHPTLINCKNGMLDMEKRELVPHDPVWGSRTQLPVSYDPANWPKLWPRFLDEIFPDDPDASKHSLLQQFSGYCLVRDARYQKALFLYGTGANGKSTVLDVLTAMVGQENTSSLTLHDLGKQFRAQFLQNKLINVCGETDTRDPLTTETFKKVVDGSPVTTERKYGEPFQYRPFAKWIVAMNEAPVIPDKSYGFGRRVLVLNFNRRFAPEEIKPRLADELIAEEIDAIFTWAVDGLYFLLENGGFEVGQQVMDDTDKLMEVLNPLLIFVTECCEIHDDAHESSTKLWNAYSAWCAEGKNRPLGRNKFYEQIMATFTRVKKVRKQEDGVQETRFDGIRLTDAGKEYAEKGAKRSNKLFE